MRPSFFLSFLFSFFLSLSSFKQIVLKNMAFQFFGRNGLRRANRGIKATAWIKYYMSGTIHVWIVFKRKNVHF